jgi:hypothetical protein
MITLPHGDVPKVRTEHAHAGRRRVVARRSAVVGLPRDQAVIHGEKTNEVPFDKQDAGRRPPTKETGERNALLMQLLAM